MAQIDHRVTFSKAVFPMLARDVSRTVALGSKGEESTNATFPAVIYCHNVLPTEDGYESVGYTTAIPAVDSEQFQEMIVEFYGDEKTRYYMGWNQYGEAYVLDPAVGVWDKLPATVPTTFSPTFDIETVTFGTVNGVTYFLYRGISAFVYDESVGKLVAVTLTGLDLNDILGITASYGYLIAYTSSAIAWSSTIDPTDFIPSSVTGAGGGNVDGIGGAIKFAFANPLGILIYATTNIIAATYTGNVQYPFRFREVDSSKGGTSSQHVAFAANAADQFAFSRAGIQAINSQKARITLPEVTDFILGDIYEDFDETTNTFQYTDLVDSLLVKLELISSRYLIISYGITSYTYALVYDLALERMGKLKIDHVTCFEYASSDTEVSKESIAFLQQDGTVKFVNTNSPASDNGVLIAGKFQYVRSRMVTMQHVEIENIETGATLEVIDMYAVDGKNTTNSTGYLALSSDLLRVYNFHVTGKNHSILLKGSFDLTTLLLAFSTGGRR